MQINSIAKTAHYCYMWQKIIKHFIVKARYPNFIRYVLGLLKMVKTIGGPLIGGHLSRCLTTMEVGSNRLVVQ